MPCAELLELEASYNRYNQQSIITSALLTAGRGEFSKWQRAGRARLAWTIQMHRQACVACRADENASRLQGMPAHRPEVSRDQRAEEIGSKAL